MKYWCDQTGADRSCLPADAHRWEPGRECEICRSSLPRTASTDDYRMKTSAHHSACIVGGVPEDAKIHFLRQLPIPATLRFLDCADSSRRQSRNLGHLR